MEEFEYINPLWQLASSLTVYQAAGLIAGYDPNCIRFDQNGQPSHFANETNWTVTQGIGWVQTAFIAVTNAVLDEKLKAKLRYSAQPRYIAGIDNLMERGHWQGEDVTEIIDNDNSSYVITAIPDWSLSTIDRDDICSWLTNNGIRTGFFFPTTSTDTPDYLNKNHPRYSAKLAATIKVWLAMEDENLLSGKSSKAAITGWLENRYQELGLIYDGKTNKTGIEECFKVANWNDKGGSPKTPTS